MEDVEGVDDGERTWRERTRGGSCVSTVLITKRKAALIEV